MIGVVLGFIIFIATIPIKTILLAKKVKDVGVGTVKFVKNSNEKIRETINNTDDKTDEEKELEGKQRVKKLTKAGVNLTKKAIDLTIKAVILAVKATIAFVRTVAVIITSWGAVSLVLTSVITIMLISSIAGAGAVLNGVAVSDDSSSNTTSNKSKDGKSNDSSGVRNVDGLVYPPEGLGQAVPIYYQSSSAVNDGKIKDSRTQTKEGKYYHSTKLKNNGHEISGSGCWLCSCAMAASYMAGKEINPIDLLNMIGGENNASSKYYDPGGGGIISNLCDFLLTIDGIKGNWTVKHETSSDNLLKALKNGSIAVVSTSKGWATGSGHIILLRGTDGKNGVYVNDPHYNNGNLKSYGFYKESDFPSSEDEHLSKAWDYDKYVEPFLKKFHNSGGDACVFTKK